MSIYFMPQNGQIINLDSAPYRMLAQTDLFDFEYDYEVSTKGKAQNLTPKISPKTIRVVITGRNTNEIDQYKQELLEAIDGDSYVSAEGKLYVDSYYLPGVFVASKKPTRYINANMAQIELTFYPNSAVWFNEDDYYYFEGHTFDEQEFLDYEYDYEYDFMNKNMTGDITNDSYLPIDAIIKIDGPAVNPVISIGQNNYGIIGELKANESVEINTERMTVTKLIYPESGFGMVETENIFNQRIRDFNIFEKIATGYNNIVWNGLFSFVISLIKQRREPLFYTSPTPPGPEPPGPTDPPIIL